MWRSTGPMFSYKLRYIVGFGLANLPTIYRNLYDNTDSEPYFCVNAGKMSCFVIPANILLGLIVRNYLYAKLKILSLEFVPSKDKPFA